MPETTEPTSAPTFDLVIRRAVRFRRNLDTAMELARPGDEITDLSRHLAATLLNGNKAVLRSDEPGVAALRAEIARTAKPSKASKSTRPPRGRSTTDAA